MASEVPWGSDAHVLVSTEESARPVTLVEWRLQCTVEGEERVDGAHPRTGSGGVLYNSNTSRLCI